MRDGLLAVGLLLCVVYGCEEDTSPALSLNELYWLQGEWKGQGGGGMWFEAWEKQQNGNLTGSAYTLKGPDTVFTETMRIRQQGAAIIFEADVAHNEAPVPFELVEVTKKGAVFQNLEHDFPTRIIYAHTKGDMLLARIEGVRDGKPDTVRFFMSRVVKFSIGTNTPRTSHNPPTAEKTH